VSVDRILDREYIYIAAESLEEEGLTVIMVTHELSHTAFTDRVVKMEDGIIKET
jgi:ABC-type lipoprotein export system ATPase subunit